MGTISNNYVNYVHSKYGLVLFVMLHLVTLVTLCSSLSAWLVAACLLCLLLLTSTWICLVGCSREKRGTTASAIFAVCVVKSIYSFILKWHQAIPKNVAAEVAKLVRTWRTKVISLQVLCEENHTLTASKM